MIESPGWSAGSATAGVAWPGLPIPNGQALLSLLHQFDETQAWSPPQLRVAQGRQLRALLTHAARTVPHHRGVTAAAAEMSHDEDPFAVLAQWPILGKADLQRSPPDFLSDAVPAAHGALHWVSTSGSQGQPLRTAYTTLVALFQHALQLRGHLWSGLHLERKLAVIRVSTRRAAFPDWGPPATLAFRTGPLVTHTVMADHGEQLDWLCAEAPAYLYSHNTNLHALVRRSRVTGRVPRGVEAVLGFADLAAPGLRHDIAELWGARYHDTYSCSEIGALALECPQQGRKHVQSERVIVEILRDDGTPCIAGEPGRVVVTDLHNFAMPLIRYDLGDIAVWGDACACGRGLPVIERIVGRAGQLAVDPTGRTFFPHLNMDFWVTAAPILQRQLAQVAVDGIEVRYVAGRGLSADEMHGLTVKIRAAMRYDYRLHFKRVERIEPGPGGKFVDFIALDPG